MRLAEIENIVGVKESSGSISQIAAIMAQAPDGSLYICESQHGKIWRVIYRQPQK